MLIHSSNRHQVLPPSPRFSGEKKRPAIPPIDVNKANQLQEPEGLSHEAFIAQITPYLGWSPRFLKALEAQATDPSNPDASSAQAFLDKFKTQKTITPKSNEKSPQ
jgi:hypothetical protein